MRLDDLDRLERFTEPLARLFYSLMAVALLAALFGSTGTALFLLLLGAAAHVVRFSIEMFVEQRRPRRLG
jgi:hypothetical protein